MLEGKLASSVPPQARDERMANAVKTEAQRGGKAPGSCNPLGRKRVLPSSAYALFCLDGGFVMTSPGQILTKLLRT